MKHTPTLELFQSNPLNAVLYSKQLNLTNQLLQQRIFGRITEISFEEQHLKQYQCLNCLQQFSLFRECTCLNCGQTLTESVKQQKESIKIFNYTIETIDGEAKYVGFEQFVLGQVYQLELANKNIILHEIINTQPINQIVQTSKCSDIVRFLLRQSENILNYLNPLVHSKQLVYVFLQIQLTLLSNDKLLIESNQHNLISRIFEKLLNVIQQNSDIIVVNNLKQTVTQPDKLVFDKLKPNSILYLNDIQFKSSPSFLNQLIKQQFQMELFFKQQIIQINYDLPAIMIVEKGVQGAQKIEIKLDQNKSNTVAENVQSLAWFVKQFGQNHSMSIVVENDYRQHISDLYSLEIKNFSELCVGIMRMVGVAVIDDSIQRAANAVGVLFQLIGRSGDICDIERIIRDVEGME